MLQSFFEGLVIGFSIAAPVGPIGLLCIQRTLARGRASGWVSGLGAATADAFYGAVAGFGVTSVSALLIGQQVWVHLLGGVFLVWLGARIFLSAPGGQERAIGGESLSRDYASTLGLTLANPLTIVSFVAIFAGLGLATGNADYASATLLVSGVFGGSLLWWTVLGTSVGALRRRIGLRAMRWINRISGAAIAAFGVIAVATLLI